MSVPFSSTPRVRTQRASHLRHVSNGSSSPVGTSASPISPRSTSGAAQRNAELLEISVERRCTLWIHDETFSKEQVLLNLDFFPEVKAGSLMAIIGLKTDTGLRDFQGKAHGPLVIPSLKNRSSTNLKLLTGGLGSKHDVDLGRKYIFMVTDMPKELKLKHPGLELSVDKTIADAFAFKIRSNVLLSNAHIAGSSASHVELSFKDEYLARSDMWRLVLAELSNKSVYKGQKILFMGTIKAQVTAVYVDGSEVYSAFSSADTKPIFRSESARYVIFIQMSKEMWDFDSEGSGEIMFNKVVNGFLPTLFKKWVALKARHLVSIVMFTRVEYDKGVSSELETSSHDTTYHTGVQVAGNKKPYKDFYRVVVNEMASGEWTTILYQLKREFKFFLRDISMHRIDTVNAFNQPQRDSEGRVLGTQIEAEPSLAMHGNVLEAIDLASSQFSHDYIDRDLVRTGISIVVITPCAGLFEVDHEKLRSTTEILIANGIGIDLVCLPKMPLHSVPLFRYRNPRYAEFQEIWHMKSFGSENSTPRQGAPIFGSYSSIDSAFSPSKFPRSERSAQHGFHTPERPPEEWSFAIPHWIDVSFWTGASQAFLGTESQVSHSGKKGKSGTSDFETRCKMYEMEMASTMDNGMTEIEVTPLHDEVLYHEMMKTSQEALDAHEGQERGEATGHLELRNLHASLTELQHGSMKHSVERHSSKAEKAFFKSLDKFDAVKAKTSHEMLFQKRRDNRSRVFKIGSDDTVRKLLAEAQRMSGTSLIDENLAPEGLGIPKMALSGKMKSSTPSMISPPKEVDPKPPKCSPGSTKILGPKPPSSKPRFGRQISLGKFGFGIAAPKAATAEIQIENASAITPGYAKQPEQKKDSTSAMVNHLMNNYTQHDRPMSSQSGSSRAKSDSLKSPETTSGFESPGAPASPAIHPMTIKSALQSLDSTNQHKSRSVLRSVYEGTEGTVHESRAPPGMKGDDNQRVLTSKLMAGAGAEIPSILSWTTALAPWLTVLNPSNPLASDITLASQYRRWQHVFPKPTQTKTMKWKSLCSPASVPLTTEYFPTRRQLDVEYEQKPYSIAQNVEDDLTELPKTREEFLRQLVGLRLSQGFQIVIGPAVGRAMGQKPLKIANLFDRDRIAEDGSSVFMSMGNIIHQLSCVNAFEIEVNVFVRKPAMSIAGAIGGSIAYYPAVRTALGNNYISREISLGKQKSEYNWNYVDSFVAGFDEEMTEHLRFWRARFVLIPTDRPTQARRRGEDSEEEIRLEGIRKLTQMWQRHRYVAPSGSRFQNMASKVKGPDPNPLDIVYKTDDPSVVVTAELESLPIVENGDPATRRRQLWESDRFHKTKLDIAALAEAIQALPEKGGVRMGNKRWHFRLHYNCFIGADMTTWLLENFEDIENRDQAVELGNLLMYQDEQQRHMTKDGGKEKDKDLGIFVHVEKRHAFRDGHYFYQVTGEFAKQPPESRSGWFGPRRRDTSVPSTPVTEAPSRDSPQPDRVTSANDESSSSGMATPTTIGMNSKKPRVALSKVMKYDVDHRRRSYRPERINLHYDRLHNPDNCYHIRIDWMNVTAKLISDAIDGWAVTAERYGLRLVEVPIGEVCSINNIHPFRAPYAIDLALAPPDQQPKVYFDTSSFGPQPSSAPASRHYYQKLIMKRFNFVLDIEAATNFPNNVDVTYSWGRPDFKYSQYIHRSGVVLAQITDEGNFLLLANRLYNNRTIAGREVDRVGKADFSDRARMPNLVGSSSPFASPILRPVHTASNIHPGSPLLRATADFGPALSKASLADLVTPETVTASLELFCQSAALLGAFYEEQLERTAPPGMRSPYSATGPQLLRGQYAGSVQDGHIPVLGLPPGVLDGRREQSPGTGMHRRAGIGGMLGRRGSVQVGSGREESPRGSLHESDRS